jgi:hypothetical protein
MRLWLSPSRRTIRLRALLGVAALSVVVSGCTGGSSDGESDTTATIAPKTSTSTSTSAAVPDDPGALDVAVVADSEVPSEVVDLLDGRADISVSSRVTEPGWTVEKLDAGFDAALASKPDVLVYSAGANDLPDKGISGMLPLVESRVDEAKAATCVVYIVPAVDTAAMEEPERSQTDQLLGAFKDVVSGWGVKVVSYPDIAKAMADEGKTFFKGEGLGSFHPGESAYPRIADAIAEQIGACA